MSSTYRWNKSELAAAYDADAEAVHPFYREVQDALLEELQGPLEEGGEVVDLGAGSARLVERVLERFPTATATLVDQSEAFLDLARQRLKRYANRCEYIVSRLQDDWAARIDSGARAVLSMSAIHHLDPEEKQRCYAQAFEILTPGGLFANGDEVRAESDEVYLAQCRRWGEHMRRGVESGRISLPMAAAIETWQVRNIDQWQTPKVSGDDCHETVAAQLGYLEAAGFLRVESGWSRELWTVVIGRK